MRPGGDGEAHVRRGERGRIVDPVAGHSDQAVAALEAGHLGGFLCGQDFCAVTFDTQLRGDGLRGAHVIAGQHDGFDSHLPQP